MITAAPQHNVEWTYLVEEQRDQIDRPGNTKGGSNTVPLSSCLTGLESEASLLNKRLMLSSSFRCDQIYKYEIYDFGHTL